MQWDPRSRMGGGSFQRNNDLWITIKALCARGLNLRCSALPLYDSVALKASAYRHLAGTQLAPLPVGFGRQVKLSRPTFIKQLTAAISDADLYNCEGAYRARTERLTTRASELGLRVGTAPKDGGCFFHSVAALIGADAAVLRADVRLHLSGNRGRYSDFLTYEDIAVNVGPDFLPARTTSRSSSTAGMRADAVWETYITNLGNADWRTGELAVRATAATIGRPICVVTDDESLSYRLTYYPLTSPPPPPIHVGYEHRVHYVPLLPMLPRARRPPSRLPPTPERTAALAARNEVLSKIARDALRSVTTRPRLTVAEPLTKRARQSIDNCTVTRPS